jgi:hypothetical protein
LASSPIIIRVGVDNHRATKKVRDLDSLQGIGLVKGFAAFAQRHISKIACVTGSCRARRASMVLCRTRVKMVTGSLAPLSAQIARSVNMKSVFAGRKMGKGRLHFHAGRDIRKKNFSLDASGIEYGY